MGQSESKKQEQIQTLAQKIDMLQPFNSDDIINLFKKNSDKNTTDSIIKFCKYHADKGNVDACLLLGEIYNNKYPKCYNVNDFDAAIKYFNIALEKGDKRTYEPLAHMYYLGYDEWSEGKVNVQPTLMGPDPDYKKSLKLLTEGVHYHKGIKAGFMYCNMAVHYEYGYGVPIDYKLAIMNYIKGYECGYIEIIHKIKYLFENEKGCEMKSDECLKWMYKYLKYQQGISKTSEYTNALLLISKIYMQRENYDSAFKYCTMAKDNADSDNNSYYYPYTEKREDSIKCQNLYDEIMLKQELQRDIASKIGTNKIKQMEKIMNEQKTLINQQKEQIDILLSITKVKSFK